MAFSDFVRRSGFWFVDYLKGGNVRKHYEDISNLFNNPALVEKHQVHQFNELAKYATENTVFYQRYRGCTALQDFPIIDKNTIKAFNADFQSPLAIAKNSIRMHTSGSTGTPMVVIQDKNKRDRVYAEMMYLWGLSGYKIGMRYMFLRRWNNINKKSSLTAYARNLIMQDVEHLDETTLSAIAKHLSSDKHIKMIIGYASTLNMLADYLDKNNYHPSDFSVKTILSGSEVLTEKTRSTLKKVFGCNVISLYSNQENGMLAIECNSNKEFHLNNASYIFEVLKIDKDEPADAGELGRIVVTDLYNYAMPLIRYDTGDLTVRKERSDCDMQGEVVERIEGRKVDVVYDTNGKALSPHAITNGLWRFDQLRQFQLIQKSRCKYELTVNDPDDAYSDEEMISTCKEFFGKDAKILIKRVSDIPVLASGKFRYIICENSGDE